MPRAVILYRERVGRVTSSSLVHHSPFHTNIQCTMNSFVERFSLTSAAAEIRKAKEILGDEDGAEAMWGSEAGFGNLASGVPRFNVPQVADVRVYHSRLHAWYSICALACGVPANIHE